MSIFNPNYKLLNKYITEADNNEDEEDYSIDDKEFNTDDDADKAAEDLVNGDNESDADKAADDLVNGDDTEETGDNSEADKAADDLVNDDTDTNNEDNNDTDTNDTTDGGNDDESDSDFDINLDDQGDGEDTGDESNDTGMDSDTGDDSGDTGDSDSGDVTNELVDKEKEIFSDLTEDQMKIKVKELKESYTTLLSVIDDINSRVTGIPKNSNNIKILKFISSKLLDLKKIANDYLINSFNTKTYIENVIFYQTSLAHLNTIKKVLEEMADKSENKDNKKAEK